MMIANVVPAIQANLAPIDQASGGTTEFANVSGYQADIFFEGTSVYFGYQANVAYQLNDMISLGLGMRYVTAKNTYNGYIKDVKVGIPDAYGGGFMDPGAYVEFVGTQVPSQQEALNGFAALLDDGTSVEADVEQTGSGYTPIVSLNIAPSEKLNVSLKYEFKTSLELTNKVMDGKDAGGMFIDGEKVIADMPAQLVGGLSYKPTNALTISTGVHYYFDQDVDYDGSAETNINMIDKNFIEYGLGLEYGLSEDLRISGGWLTTITGVNDNYQTDQSYSLPSNTFGAGIGFSLTEMIDLNLGGSYTLYQEGEKTYDAELPVGSITEVYDKDIWIVALGVNFHF